ncbi:MAG: plasmid mobilization relaxosome protein MobC [Clostridiales bacterium]|nr:plasmid mobilization relaxosome protein MobC [Clostridiales bacterium]
MNKRKHQVLFRLNDAEYEELNRNVTRSGLSREKFIRSALSNVTFKEMPPLEFFDILKNLRQINNNLNQIAMRANSYGIIDTRVYRENYSRLQEQIGEIIRGIY